MKEKSKHKLQMPWGRMAYSHAGEGGPAMVFLHGTGCDSADWGDVVRHLPSSLQCVCVDFRGHGASDVPSSAFTLLRQKALRLSASVARATSAEEAAAGMILRCRSGYGGQDGVLGSRRRPLGYGGQVAGFRKDSTCVANATPAKQVAPRLAAGCFTLADLAADVAALLEALHLSKVILVGHSLGGMVAMEVASRARCVIGMVLLEGWTQLRAARAFPEERFYGHLPPGVIRDIKEKYDKTINAFRPAIWRTFWESVESFDGSPQLRAARIPVFEVYGDMARVPSTESLLMIPSNPAISLFWIAGAGHYLAHEKPLDVARICAQMLDRCEQANSKGCGETLSLK